MPNRMLRDSVRTSKTLHRLSAEGERMFYRLVTVADDHGRFIAEPAVLRSTCFPLDDGKIRVASVEKWRDELAQELITLYRAGDTTYGFFRTWEKHQTVRAKSSKFPMPASASTCAQMIANAPVDEDVVESRETKSRDEVERRETEANTNPRAD